MKKAILLLTVLIFASYSHAQTVKFQMGTTLAKLNWQVGGKDLNMFDETLIAYSFFTGIDYFENRYFNVSSNLGLIQKGGKGMIVFTTETGEPAGEVTKKARLNYLTINTAFDLKYTIKDKLLPFISLGPRFDYLVNYSSQFDGLKDMAVLKKYNLGLILGAGIRYNLSKMQLGIKADYYLNLDEIAVWPAQPENLGGKIVDKTMTINLTLGYKL